MTARDGSPCLWASPSLVETRHPGSSTRRSLGHTRATGSFPGQLRIPEWRRGGRVEARAPGLRRGGLLSGKRSWRTGPGRADLDERVKVQAEGQQTPASPCPERGPLLGWRGAPHPGVGGCLWRDPQGGVLDTQHLPGVPMEEQPSCLPSGKSPPHEDTPREPGPPTPTGPPRLPHVLTRLLQQKAWGRHLHLASKRENQPRERMQSHMD